MGEEGLESSTTRQFLLSPLPLQQRGGNRRSWEVGAFVLPDMSAAFDTIEHLLQKRFDVQDAALDWFASYFADRTQKFEIGDDSSFVSGQGSVLGLRSFVAFAKNVTDIFHHHRVCHHLFADDMQGIPGTASHPRSRKWLGLLHGLGHV